MADLFSKAFLSSITKVATTTKRFFLSIDNFLDSPCSLEASLDFFSLQFSHLICDKPFLVAQDSHSEKLSWRDNFNSSGCPIWSPSPKVDVLKYSNASGEGWEDLRCSFLIKLPEVAGLLLIV